MSMPGTAFNDVGLDLRHGESTRIGMDGSALVASLAEGANDVTRSRLKDLHSRYYRRRRRCCADCPVYASCWKPSTSLTANRLGDVGETNCPFCARSWRATTGVGGDVVE
jgi:hypothetical protein